MLTCLYACSDDAITNDNESAVEHAAKHLDSTFVCPMHSQIIKNAPGNCPICGMDLIAKKVDLKPITTPEVNISADIIQKLGIRTSQAKQRKLVKTIKTVGYILYNEHQLKTISVKTDGWIENLSIRRLGLSVQKGQLMLELYSPEFIRVQKEFIKARKKDNSGILRKYDQRNESIEPRDQLRYMQVPESMMNEIARRGKPKHRLPIYAPMQGIIVAHNIHKHKFVEEDEPMMVIADLSTVWVEANIYEHQLEWIKRGLLSEIKVKSLPGKKFKAQLTYIYPELDSRTRTLKVRMLVANPDRLLIPNMFAEVHVFSEAKNNVLTLPREALIVTGQRESVILDLGNGKYKPVTVVTGMRNQEMIEILSGIKNNDRVVVSGQFLIDSEANLQASFNRFGKHAN